MTNQVFDTQHMDMAEVASVNAEGITLLIPVAATGDGENEHAWQAKMTLELTKDVAIRAGMPEKVFELDDIHYQEYSGAKLSELMELVEHNKKPSLHFNLHF